MRFSSDQLENFARRLGLTPKALSRCREGATHEERLRRLQELRERIRTSYRNACLACHPDRHPNDQRKAEEFKGISSAYSEIKDLLDQQDLEENQITKETIRVGNLRVSSVVEPTNSGAFSANWWER